MENVNQRVNGHQSVNQSTTELKNELHQMIDGLQDTDVLECVYKVVHTFQVKNPTKKDATLTHFASEKVLAKDWSSPIEDEVWQDL